MAVMFGIAINATISRRSVFARKNYFYPDLPKGYQISQYELPIVTNGEIEIPRETGTTKRIRINRAHLEEDAGKSVHGIYGQETGVDLNRAGIPLLEIVSEPDMRSEHEATEYMRAIHSLVRYLQICDGNMAEGSFRCDANVSVRPSGDNNFGTRTEIKNLNSFRFLGRAIRYEINRQIETLKNGQTVVQETRLYDPEANETRVMRGKEEANDYRYFPDPDLLPVELTPTFIEGIRIDLPELPSRKTTRFRTEYGLSEHDAKRLTCTPETAEYYEAVLKRAPHPKTVANWVIGTITSALHRADLDITRCPIQPEEFAVLIARIHDGTLSTPMAKTVFDALWHGNAHTDDIIKKQGLSQISDPHTIDAHVDHVINAYPDQVKQFQAGKEKLLAFLVGQVMKITRGRANPHQVTSALRRKL